MLQINTKQATPHWACSQLSLTNHPLLPTESVSRSLLFTDRLRPEDSWMDSWPGSGATPAATGTAAPP